MRIVHDARAAAARKPRRERVLRSVAVLPSLATLGNLVCGFAAIYMCLLSAQAGGTDLAARAATARFAGIFPTYVVLAAYLVVAAMFFDAIDGRLARFTRRTSEFGAQLDSLADIVSFGIAPAVVVLCIVRPIDPAVLAGWPRVYWRVEWVMAAVYVSCAALRLARFNVENVEDESAHLGFRGLPSPGAAAAVIGLVIFHQDLLPQMGREHALHAVTYLLPPAAMVLGLLMVSRFRYLHVINAVLRGRRPFWQVVAIGIAFLAGLVVQFQLTIAVAASAYALSGPARWLRSKLRPHDAQAHQAPDASASPASVAARALARPSGAAAPDHPPPDEQSRRTVG